MTRYGSLMLGPELKTERIEAEGAARDISTLSVGTRERLATLIRLSVKAGNAVNLGHSRRLRRHALA